MKSIHFLGFWVECPGNYQRIHFFRVLCLVHVPRVSVHYEENPPGAYLELDG